MNNPSVTELDLGVLRLVPGADQALFQLNSHGLKTPLFITMPVFEIDGDPCGPFEFVGLAGERSLTSGGRERLLNYHASRPAGLALQVILRSFPGSPILRFKYRLSSGAPARLTRSGGQDRITYFDLRFEGLESFNLTEYQLSHFDPVAHSYMPDRVDRQPGERFEGERFTGPVALLHSAQSTLLAAYEHGTDQPLSFLEFACGADGSLALQARLGNYFHGQPLGPGQSWESAWFELGLFPGPLPEFLPVYRQFFLNEVCENRESRKPYLYYNTWNYQERQRYFKNRPYIESMQADRILAEIDAAHRLGIDVFVIDTGWYTRTGDWLVNLERFPEGLREVKRRLDGYGMKLGLWFNPTVAALNSSIFLAHPEYEMTWNGSPRWRGPVWETDVSGGMCLASGYTDYFIEVMVRLHRELGVSYFKWDGVQQVGCNSPLHLHGTEENSPEERADCYAYQMGLSMIRIVEEVARRCPEVIVDFDITEGGRFVGLGFLSAGKYFLVNNGPYFADFDIPRTVKIDPDTINVFFYPGPARPRICRQGVKYDEIIPSILFLTHYLPDGPQLAQRNSLAALMLGGNGIWGDLLALSEAEIDFQAGQLAFYKQVGEAVTRAYPRLSGFAGSSPEIHEKIDPAAGAGLVAFFTVAPGTMTHMTQPINLEMFGRVEGADRCEVLPGGRLKLTVVLERDDARVVFILPNPDLPKT